MDDLGKTYHVFASEEKINVKNFTNQIGDATFSQIPLSAPHRTTGLQIITSNYRLTMTNCWQITSIYMVFTIKDIYRYRRFTDKAGLFTADYRR